MLYSDQFAFVHMPKTAGTHITNILSEYVDLRQSDQKHDVLNYRPTNKIVVGSIRNPWDWYVSYWAFSCMGVGQIFDKTTRYPRLNQRLSAWLGVAPENIPLNRKGMRTAQQWWELYRDWRDPSLFREWLTRLLTTDLGIRKAKECGSQAGHGVGYMTHAWLYYSSTRPIWKKEAQYIQNKQDAKAFFSGNCIIDYYISVENIERDYALVLNYAGHKVSEYDIKGFPQANTSRRMDAACYYNQDMIELVAKKDALIIEEFKYKPPK